MSFCLGISTSHVTDLAIQDALRALRLPKTGLGKAAMVWIRPDIHDQPATLGELKKQLPHLQLVGGSTSDIHFHHAQTSQACTLAIVGFGEEVGTTKITALHYAQRTPDEVVSRLYAAVNTQPQPPAMVINFSDPTWSQHSSWVHAWTKSYPQQTLIDITTHAATPNPACQYLDKQVLTESLASLALWQSPAIGLGTAHAFTPVGLHRTITAAQNGVIQEVDDQPALSLYQTYFANLGPMDPTQIDQLSLTYPLGIWPTDTAGHAQPCVTPAKLLPDANLAVPFSVQKGQKVSLMITSAQAIQSALTKAAQQAQTVTSYPTAVLVLLSHLNHLGGISPSLEPLQKIFGSDIPLLAITTAGSSMGFHVDPAAVTVWAVG